MTRDHEGPFPEEDESTTARLRPKGAFVLAVHDSSADFVGLWMALEGEFIVHQATTPFEALERLSGAPLACIVCVVGGSIRAEDFFDLVVRISADQARRIVFIGPVADLRSELLQRSGCNSLSLPVQPEELLVLVRAVSATKG